MSQFLSGAAVDCGPSNVLKNVGGRLERDFSLQQDRLVSTPNVAGPSTQAFKPSISRPATRSSTTSQAVQSPFDLSALGRHLNSPPVHTQARSHDRSAARGWADAFVPQQAALARPNTQAVSPLRQASPWQADFQQHLERPQSSFPPPSLSQANVPPWQRAHFQPAYAPPLPQFYPVPQPSPVMVHHPPAPAMLHPPQEAITVPSEPASKGKTFEPSTEPQDLLARTAETFVNGVAANELLAQNPKLAGSKFMALIHGLAEGLVVVDEGEHVASADQVGEGPNFVQRNGPRVDWAGDSLSEAVVDVPISASRGAPPIIPAASLAMPFPANGTGIQPRLGNGQATPGTQAGMGATSDTVPAQQFDDQEALVMSDARPATQRRKSVHFDTIAEPASLGSGVPAKLSEALAHSTAISGAASRWEEQGLDDDDFGQEAFMAFNGPLQVARDVQLGVGDLEGWRELQKDWEEFQRSEPVAQGVRGMGIGDMSERYLFQSSNPYAQVGLGGAHVFDLGRESPTLRGVLELEAAVQDDPTSHQAWYALGLKQQENERDDAAILALSKVVQLAPEYRAAYLALAVSFTNESAHKAANTMLERWLDIGEGKHVGAVRSSQDEENWAEGQKKLVNRLIDVARRNPEDVDADTQVALGVLFNTSEEYDKAEDCFMAALSARPDDWLLYNRLGATLANSGRSNEAIEYYHKALSLHPNFVRALFNLGISHANLGQYPLAAQRILDALHLQHADATEGYVTGKAGSIKGITSDTLWNTLRTACIHMGRQDLAELASRKDITGFPLDIVEAPRPGS